ncbi:hypothetical protein DFH07DRAFT_728671, partial [Mycena maculata]
QQILIPNVLGTPTLVECYAITTSRSRNYIRVLPFRKCQPYVQWFLNADLLAVDFLAKMLT